MTLNDVLTKQNVITKIILKDGDKELPKELKVKIMRIRMAYNKIKKQFDDDTQEFTNQIISDELRELANKSERTPEEEARFNELNDKTNSEYQEYLIQKGFEEVKDTPDDVINLSTLYMRIYFMGMPFFMLYNYGASILRAVGDTKRPLFFLIIAGIANAGLNMCLVIIFHLGVAGVAIGTVISQFISSVLVLRCLYQSQTSYQLRFSKLKINVEYLEQIFQVGIPAGIQSTVINFSNVLLQSSVNSFGSIAMAGYTAANNIFGFLYVTVNAVTQACMSFTSQNYGVGKWKRMDRVLIDCLILSFIAMMILGNSAYFFGPKLLTIYTSNPKVIQCGMEILLYTTVTYFLCGFMDLFPGALRGMGRSGVPMILSIIGTVGTRIVWIFWIFPSHRSLDILFISYPASWIITIILQVICYYFVRKQLYGKKIAQA